MGKKRKAGENEETARLPQSVGTNIAHEPDPHSADGFGQPAEVGAAAATTKVASARILDADASQQEANEANE
jgi:hypothetical protein